MKKIIPSVLGSLLLVIIMFSVVGAADVTSGGNKIDPKPAGGYVTSTEFNNIVDTLRGIYNTLNGGIHSWGINKTPETDITLDVDGPISFGANIHSNICDNDLAGSIYFNSTNKHFWYCNGSDWQQMDGSLPSSINGVCNNSIQNGCSTGVANDGAVADTSTLWKWACDGQYGGTTVPTCQKNKPVNGVCNNSIQNGCSTGVANDGAVADTSTLWKWACDGQYGGAGVLACQKNKPVNGVCNNSIQNGCSTGVANDGAVADTSTLWKWACDGQYGGIDDLTCQKGKDKIIGVCGVGSIVNACDVGVANDEAVADTRGFFKWRCDAEDGNSGICQQAKAITCKIYSESYESQPATDDITGCSNNAGYYFDSTKNTELEWKWKCGDGETQENNVYCGACKIVTPACNEEITDINFQNAIVAQLGKNNWSEVNNCDLLGITDINFFLKDIHSIAGICQFKNLKSLQLEQNKLTELPDSITTLIKLEWIHLTNNRITSLPNSIGDLVNLYKIGLYNNQITSLPDSIGNLTKLRVLSISHNQITSLPDSIGNLSFSIFVAENTSLTDVSKLNNSRIGILSLKGSPLNSFPSGMIIDKLYIENTGLTCEDIDKTHINHCYD